MWFVLGACLALVSISLTFLYPNGLADPNQATLFRMPAIGIIWGVGLLGVLLSERTGFPDAWDTSTSAWRRLVLPAVVGIVLGVAMMILDYVTHFSQLIAAHHGLKQQYTEFMPMFLAFSVGGSILVEVIYRLLPIPLLLWLISTVILKKRGQTQTFWVLAILLSALEPLGFTSDLSVLPIPVMVMDASLMYVVNLTQATFFRKYGFLASILVRAGFYLVWHALYVH
jgi:hypothetical protein